MAVVFIKCINNHAFYKDKLNNFSSATTNGLFFQITTNKLQRLFIYLFISTDAVRVSGCSSAHHQEHKTVHTASGTVNQYSC